MQSKQRIPLYHQTWPARVDLSGGMTTLRYDLPIWLDGRLAGESGACTWQLLARTDDV